METKFTKGNWESHERSIRCNGRLIITCWNTKEIYPEKLEGESWLDWRERTKEDREIYYRIEPKANAKLIAAAPDMYNALSKLAEEVEKLIEFTSEQGIIDWEDNTIEGVINMENAKKNGNRGT